MTSKWNSNRRGRRYTKNTSHHKRNIIPINKKINKNINYAEIDNKDVLFIWDRPRTRSPNLTDFFNCLTQLDTPLFKAIFIKDLNSSLPALCKKHLNGKPPKFLYTGFVEHPFDNITKKYIISNNIKLICETADANAFIKGQNSGPFIRRTDSGTRGMDVKLLIHRSMFGRNNVINATKQYNSLKNANVLHIPWSLVDDKFHTIGDTKNKTIDVSYICHVHPPPIMKHKYRRQVFNILRTLKKDSKLNIVLSEKMNNKQYIKTLKDSKIFIIITNIYAEAMTQKYIEGAASRCLLIGDITNCAKKVFTHNKSMIDIKNNYTNIPKIIKRYLNNDGRRKDIANSAYNIAYNNFRMSHAIDKFINAFKKYVM